MNDSPRNSIDRSSNSLHRFLPRTSAALAAAWDWILRCFERENLLAGLKTFSWLGPLTLLIWIYAEREQVVETPDPLTIPIAIQADDHNQYVRFQDPKFEGNILATLSGPRSQLDEVRRAIAPQETPTVRIGIPAGRTPGQPQEFDTAQLLNTNPIFRSHGVTVINCKPEQLRVFIDSLETKTFEVKAPRSVTHLVGTPIFEPKTVEVRAPASELSNPAVTVEADLASSGLLDKSGHQQATVRLISPKLSQAATFLGGATVKATFEVRSPDEEYKIPSVPIFVQMPIFLQKTSVVTCDPAVLSNVVVKGPPDKIAQIEHLQVQVIAVVNLTSEDKATSTGDAPQKRVEFQGLPDGVVFSEPTERTVAVTLSERGSGP